MSPHTSASRRAASAAVVATALTTPLLVTPSAQAAPCRGVPKHVICNNTSHVVGSSGGGGSGSGSGGGSGPFIPPPPEGLADNEAAGFVPVDGPAAPAAAPPSAFDLAVSAMAGTFLPSPKVRTAPADKTYIRMRTSLWVEGVEAKSTDPIGAPQVQATATPSKVVWNLGEKTIECTGLGTPKGTSCSYVYQRSSAGQPGGSWKITATVYWDVSYRCLAGGCAPGVLDPQQTTSAPTPLVVSEIQTNTGQ
ncbi:hypothetical protein [Actinomadura fibrosa]|uniref:Secreted protein n=1 Tax=Actinomadura fibrosa TaxID=111802 RepID=A0ABW2XFV2_9ACTN|nr:hypothetical protein [Actinomadura fibrosa]